MLQMTKKVEYGLIALVYLGRSGERSVSAREVAEQNDIPLSLTANVLKMLAKGNVVATRRGASGGYTLDRRLDEILLGDVMAAVEGPMTLTACCRENGHGGCDLVGSCSIKTSIVRLNQRLAAGIAQMNLRDFLELGHPGLTPARPRAL